MSLEIPSKPRKPPTYTPQDTTPQDLTSSFATLTLSPHPVSLPTPSTCLAHLKLLHAIQALKLDIGYTDGLFGIWDAKAEINEIEGSGYGDRDLSHICHKCSGYVNHDLLRVAKFRKETENLIMRDWPLGGTILTPNTGLPDAAGTLPMNSAALHFPNRLIGIELRSKILDLISPQRANPTMNDVKILIENAVANKDLIRKLNNRKLTEPGYLRRDERVAIRLMMARYWENTSIFALELGGAVIRQGVFIEKMKNLDWLHSPAATQTMERLILKYTRFITILSENAMHVCVPTLDVDLAWHTAQLSPQTYFTYTTSLTGKFIDHDDKVSEDALETGFEFTSKTYEKLYGEIYSECTCWYCEVIRSRHSGPRLFGTSKSEKLNNAFHDSAAQFCPPDNSAHISTHNAESRARPSPCSPEGRTRQRIRESESTSEGEGA
ncbi:hypothetical protein M7I_1683 [Glarea lozoyensis 74030]|uniref:Uncharacterized protein n=1 Tax=Glarea lozoyensis (strain ATCC 74030 / MF5533) TaxID=1104152 RepID=H0EGR4_GLAL7|nr:hypothetical protein M7I_1683 [Glarea lozoyensis 74030]